MPRIKFTKPGSSSVFGNFGAGDVLVCSEAEARHFVIDAECAKYADSVAPELPAGDVQAPAQADPVVRKRRKTAE